MKIIKKLIFIVLCLLSLIGFAWEGHDSTMYWQVEETGNTVDGGPNSVYMFLGIDHSNDELGVRIACYDSDGNFIRYLNPAYPDPLNYVDWEYNDQPIGT